MRRRRRHLAALLAVYSTVVASGAPLPLAWAVAWARPVAPSGERFPCESCPCGCGTAEHCWSACCCHSLPERLAWARREGVRPPETALDDARRAGLDVSEWRAAGRYVVRTPVVEPVEEEAALPPCCRKAREAAARGCCATKKNAAKLPAGVSILRAMACRGMAQEWLALGQAPMPPVVEMILCEATEYVAEAPAPLWRSWSDAPGSPPPERVG